MSCPVFHTVLNLQADAEAAAKKADALALHAEKVRSEMKQVQWDLEAQQQALYSPKRVEMAERVRLARERRVSGSAQSLDAQRASKLFLGRLAFKRDRARPFGT